MRLAARFIRQTLFTLTLLGVLSRGSGTVGEPAVRAEGADDSIEKLSGSPSARRVSLKEIRQAVSSGEFVARTADEIARLLNVDGMLSTDVIRPPQVRRAEYTARLNKNQLVAGTVLLQLYDRPSDQSVILGQTNLEELEFRAGDTEVPLAALSDGQLSLLTSNDDYSEFNGTWQASGRPGPEGMSFELRLPESSICQIRILTPAGVSVRSPGAVVRSERVGEEMAWDLFPDSGRPVSIVCSSAEERLAQTKDSIAAVDSTFRVTEQSVLFNWAMVIPPHLAGAEVSLNLPDRCQIASVSGDSGSVMLWEVRHGERPALVLKNVAGAQTVIVHGESSQAAGVYQGLPLLNQGAWKHADGRAAALLVRSTGIRMVIARHLAIDDLQLNGLYQQEVSFPSNGDQIVELRQFAVDATALVKLVASRSTARQDMLIDHPLESSGEVSVYVEIEPRSGRMYDAIWNLAGPWKPTAVTDLRSKESLYFSADPDPETGDQKLAIALRTFAGVNQSSQLRIRFRSTEAVRPDSFSIPILSNPQYRTSEYWILSSVGTEYPDHVRATVMSEAGSVVEQRFPWLTDYVLIDSTRELVQTPPVSARVNQHEELEETTVHAQADYAIQLADDRIVENVRLRLTSENSLPRSVIVVFPSGVDVQVADRESAVQISRTSRRTGDGDREWLLTLPVGRRLNNSMTISLKASRPENAAEFAAVPRLPGVLDTSMTARIVTGADSAGLRVALIADSANDDAAASTILEAGQAVLISAPESRMRLRVTRDHTAAEFLGVRGQLYCFFNSAEGTGRCRFLADLVVSRSGPVESLPVQWAESPDARFYVDDQEIWCPPGEKTSNVLLPADQPTCRLRILWTGETTFSGWLHQSARVMLPRFEGADTSNMISQVQIAADETSMSRSIGWVTPSPDDVGGTLDLVASEATPGPVRDFLIRWRLTEQQGARRTIIRNVDGFLEFRVTGLRTLWFGALVMFCCVLLLRTGITSLRVRSQVFLLLSGFLLAAFGGLETRWWLSGANVGLAVVVCGQLFREPALRGLKRMHSADIQQDGSNAPAVVASLLAVMLTGQAPPILETPAILIPQELKSGDSTVFVRKRLVNDGLADLQGDSQVRVATVDAQIQIAADGISQMTIRATVSSRRDQVPLRFVLPIEDATLTDCFVDGERVAPISSQTGRPAVLIPATTAGDRNETATGDTTKSGLREFPDIAADSQTWQSNVIEYVIRSRMDVAAARMNLRVPLPCSARCRISLEAAGDLVRSIRQLGKAAIQEDVDQPGRYEFPLLFNQGSVDLTIESNRPPTTDDNSRAVVALTCLAEIDFGKARQRLQCRYQLKSLSQSPLASELRIPEVPGFRLLECRGPDGQPMRTQAIDGLLQVGDGTAPVEEFDVTWEAQLEPTIADYTVPASALMPPAECSAQRVLIGLRVVEPFEASPALAENPDLVAVTLTDEEYSGLNLNRADRIFEVDAGAGDIPLPIVLKTDLQRVDITQQVVAGVDEVSINCRCDIRSGGSRIFRQRLHVPPTLLIDQIEVTSAGTDRLRSFSCRDGILLVTLREGTLGNCQLSFSGIIPVAPDGRSEFMPIKMDHANVQSSLLLSAKDSTTALLVDAGDARPNEPDTISKLPHPLSTNRLRFTVGDANRPVVLHTRTQQAATAQIITLLHDGSPNDGCDVAIRIAAGDQGWSGGLPAMRELTYRRADWIHDGTSTWLQPGGGELPPGRLEPGETGVLLLNGLQPQDNETVFRLRIPMPDPAVPVEEIRVLHRTTAAPASRQDYVEWMMKSLDMPDAPLPDGLDDRSQTASWDEATSILRLTGVRTSDQVAVPVNRRLRHSVSVTRLRVSGAFLSGSSDILLDFGEALETRVRLPEAVKITQCRLDGRDLSLQDQNFVIQINRERDVQRLTIEWTIASRRAGYLRQQHKLAVPITEAIKSQHFVLLHPPASESWRPDSSMPAITAAQLETRINASIQQFGASASVPPESVEVPMGIGGLVSDTVAAEFFQSYQSALPQTALVYELTTPEEAGVSYRRRLPWPQWIPIITLLALGFFTTSRKFIDRRSSETNRVEEDQTSSSETAASESNGDRQDSADVELPSNRGDSDE